MGANEAIVIGTRTDHVPPCKRVAQEFARVSTDTNVPTTEMSQYITLWSWSIGNACEHVSVSPPALRLRTVSTTNKRTQPGVVVSRGSVGSWLVGGTCSTYNSSEKGKDRNESGSPTLSSSTIALCRTELVKELSIENGGGTYHHSMRARGGA